VRKKRSGEVCSCGILFCLCSSEMFWMRGLSPSSSGHPPDYNFPSSLPLGLRSPHPCVPPFLGTLCTPSVGGIFPGDLYPPPPLRSARCTSSCAMADRPLGGSYPPTPPVISHLGFPWGNLPGPEHGNSSRGKGDREGQRKEKAQAK